MTEHKTVRRLAGVAGLAVATVALAGVTSAAAVDAPATPTVAAAVRPASVLAIDCFVTTIGVPAYDVPNRNVKFWAGEGQGFRVIGSNAYWRVGTLWGGEQLGNLWIHSNYLRRNGSHPSNPPCNL
ncbi:hypothetical protein GCM10009554_82500 [Kribbella koreensis]|uniref:SH3 domain-containing protein n=1 Tax=Kribbella koreensis TaxID=57909 RepID=A0ABP4C9J3_9ACTN